ncbi:CDP-2,3-bis-(O-geranylgeranyl)-sn-glycerol synthase [Candidatus Micrarchaeota archaeon]|nr:CDP-2,3-bis-(O-geranylgeranyl)-sn-glycerol synthase [Candidatus Micrarchaeota archaeon]
MVEASFLELIILIFPAYVANAIPVVFGGGKPVDFGKNLWGKRVFGDSKTIRGALAGFAFGAASGIAIAFVLAPFFLPELGLEQKIAVAIALSAGTIAGDLLGSFIKRRMGMKPGSQSLLLDQLPFLYTALFFAWLAWGGLPAALGVTGFIFLTVLTILLHVFFNILAHAFRLKKVPW